MGCYQHVDTRQTSCYQSRNLFWDKLDEFIFTLPKRNSFLLCGDLNCSLQQDGNHVGQDHFTWRAERRTGSTHADMHRLHTMLHTHMLQAVNTWNAKDPPTFTHGAKASRIDHFLMRCADSDALARDIKFFPYAGFLPMNGAFHIPMVCSIRKIPFHKEKAPLISSCTYQQRLQCRAAWKDQTPHWHHFVEEMDRTWNDNAWTPVDDIQAIDHMHNILRSCFQTHFPKCHTTGDSISTDQIETFQSKWYHKRQLQSIRPRTLSDVFKIWHHSCKFQALKRQQQCIACARKRQQLRDLMLEANTAAARHDHFTLYQAVQRLTPKQCKRRIRLRTFDGTIANAEDVKHLTEAHIKEVWEGPQSVQYTCTIPPGVPFTQEELEHEIGHIPVVKSVARPFLPGLCWKVRAHATAEFIYGLLEKWWNQTPIYIPQQWKQAWLIFIPKPNKPADRLTHLRPLALLEPIGKCVLGLLTKCLAAQLRPTIAAWPQFAFCANRSALDAIRRVMHHCKMTRQLIGQHRRTVHQRHQGHTPFAICGGVQMFIDVHQAFDRIPRQPLFDFLQTQGVDEGLIALLAEWHSCTEYVIMSDQTPHAVPTGRGVRQGCRAAPLLWQSYTLAMFHEISLRTSVSWVQTCLTMFADDLHTGEICHSAEQFVQALRRIGHLMDAMEHMGLTISLDKTFALIQICGTNCRKFRSSLIKTDALGQYLDIPRADKTFTKLRIRSKAKYLGVCVNYQNPELLTFLTRKTAALTTFHRLKKWLCNKHLSLRTRLQMWHSCVFMSLTYGLLAVDITLPILTKYQSLIFGMYRRILRDFGQHTGNTHAQILETHGLQHPLTLLWHVAERLQLTLSQRLRHLTTDDIVLTLDWQSLHESHQMIQVAMELQAQAPLSILIEQEAHVQTFHCRWCSRGFHSVANLRRHETHVHGSSQLRSHLAVAASFATKGLPQCTHCHETFSTWRQFQIHLERNCCQVLPRTGFLPFSMATIDQTLSAAAEPMQARHLTLLLTKPYGHQVLDIVIRGAWQDLCAIPDALKDLAKYCILCGNFHSRPQDLNLHMRTQHVLWYPNVHVKTLQLCRSQASNSPCRFCHKTFQRVHQCPVLTQLALLQVNLAATGGQPGQLHPEVLCCAVCRDRLPDLSSLHRHLAQEHQLEMTDWQPLRDLHGSDPVCAHCQSCFCDVPAVRQHITMGQCPSFDRPDPRNSLLFRRHGNASSGVATSNSFCRHPHSDFS